MSQPKRAPRGPKRAPRSRPRSFSPELSPSRGAAISVAAGGAGALRRWGELGGLTIREGLIEIGDELRGGLRARVGALGERAHHDAREGLADGGVGRGDHRRGGHGLDVAGHHHHGVLVDEGRVPDQHLVEQDAERVEIAAGVERSALRLLGGHVAGGAEDRAGLRLERVDRSLLALDLGDPEIQDLADLGFVAAGAAGEKEVIGLEIAVNDALLVGLFEREQGLARDAHGLGDLDARGPLQAGAEGLALEHLHRQVERGAALRELVAVGIGDLAEVEDRDGVRRREEAHRPGLAREAGLGLGVEGAIGAEDLDGDVAADRLLPGAVDRAHRSGADAAGDHEAIGDGDAEEGIPVGLGEGTVPGSGRTRRGGSEGRRASASRWRRPGWARGGGGAGTPVRRGRAPRAGSTPRWW